MIQLIIAGEAENLGGEASPPLDRTLVITKFPVACFKGKALHYLSHTQELSRGPRQAMMKMCLLVVVDA